MIMKATAYKVFIASPSDLEGERAIVRRVCRELSNDPLLESLLITCQGWEDLPPRAGRPQDRINRILDDCDIVVCMLHRRFGTPTGTAKSGTAEEFFRAYDSWKKRAALEIMFYFKEASVTSMKELEDPQFKEVLELKEKIQTEELLQYGNFKEAPEFERQIKRDLKKIIKQLMAADSSKEAIDGAGEKTGEEPAAAVVPEAYKNWINDHTRCMDVGCLIEDGQGVQVILAEIFQPLFGDDPDDKKKMAEDGNRRGKENLEKRQEPVEIEGLAAKGPTLLVSGLAGSGKTTLARHMARQIVNEDSRSFEKGLLPVMVYFKDLKGFDGDRRASGVNGARELLDWYCRTGHSGFLSIEIIEAFCREKRVVFLLDALDEADQEIRETAVSWFADFNIRYPGNRFILLGRPHGVGGKVTERFGERFVMVHEFTDDQALAFIDRWFDHVHVQGRITGRQIAEKMKGEVTARPDIDDLKKNPLMLTAMCILYNDLKVLPDQRADLYNRIVERLFSKFEEDKVKVGNFMMELAHSLFLKEERNLDQVEALKVFKAHFEAPRGKETWQEMFDRIEPATGLLHRENGGFKFIHLTFQEFLTARHIASQAEDGFWDPVKDHVTDARFDEVVSLYIGFVSMRNAKAANAMVKKMLSKEPSDADPREYILAAKSLLDIHRDNREKEIAALAIDRMQTLIRSPHPPKVWLDAGIAMGRLGHDPGFEEFVAIEGGTYELELEDSEKYKRVELDTFELARFPVTHAWYEKFITDKGYETEAFWSDAGWEWKNDKNISKPLSFTSRRFNCPSQPVVCISLYEAQAFCNWLSVKDSEHRYFLPTEEQWQAAAAGKKKRPYPWGEKISPERCNCRETELKLPSPVGIFLTGKTPEGIHDLAGNVWEWTSSYYDSDKDIYVFRGGAFGDGAGNCRCAARFSFNPDVRDLDIGFRCARIKL